MRRFLPSAMLVPILAFAAVGWRPLFNGKDLDGWSVASAKGKLVCTVEDGAIRIATGSGLLWYAREKIANSTLRVIYRTSAPGGNSGVFVRIASEPPGEDFALRHGFEVPFEALGRASKPAGEWNTLDIVLSESRAIVKLNGALVTRSDGVSPAAGYIALYCHDGQAMIHVREVSVKP